MHLSQRASLYRSLLGVPLSTKFLEQVFYDLAIEILVRYEPLCPTKLSLYSIKVYQNGMIRCTVEAGLTAITVGTGIKITFAIPRSVDVKRRLQTADQG